MSTVAVARFTDMPEEERHELLGVRRSAYGPEVSEEALRDEFDSDSYLVLVRGAEGRLIASLRFRAPESDQTSEFASLSTLPPEVPRWRETLEASRVCVHPSERARGHVSRVLGRLAGWAHDRQYRYLLGAAEESMLSYYREFGFQPVNRSFFRHPLAPDRRYVVVLCDYALVAKGQGVSWRRWKEAYEPVFGGAG